jgi:hypothetical protein
MRTAVFADGNQRRLPFSVSNPTLALARVPTACDHRFGIGELQLGARVMHMVLNHGKDGRRSE